jgi:protein TonB
MRFVSVAVVSAPRPSDWSLLTPSARTRRERERSLRDAIFLSCLLALAAARGFVALYEVPVPETTVVEIFRDPPHEPTNVREEPDPGPPEGPRAKDGMPVAADVDSMPPLPDATAFVPSGPSGPEDGQGSSSQSPGGGDFGEGEQGSDDPNVPVYFDEAPKVVSSVLPEYPEIARQARIEGAVMLQVRVGTDGRVHDVRVLRSAGVFDEAAIEAARRWRFEPAKVNGKPVAVWVALPVRFTLH